MLGHGINMVSPQRRLSIFGGYGLSEVRAWLKESMKR